MPDNTTSWTVSVSKRTDRAVRRFLAQPGTNNGSLSAFIEDAVKWRLFDQTLAEVRSGFDDLSPDDLEALVDEAVTATRQARKPSESKAEQNCREPSMLI